MTGLNSYTQDSGGELSHVAVGIMLPIRREPCIQFLPILISKDQLES